MSKEKKFTESIKCGHCQNQAPMEVVSRYSTIKEYNAPQTTVYWDAGLVYELIECPTCKDIILRFYNWHSGRMDVNDIEYTTLYPKDEKGPRGLPSEIESSFQAAQEVRNIDANAYAVLLGRVLDLVCVDRKASGNTLDKKLKSLSNKGEIPEKLVDVSSGLRKLRNIGAHADLGELSNADLPVLDGLTRAILEYVYSAPLLIRETEKRLAKLKSKKFKKNSK